MFLADAVAEEGVLVEVAGFEAAPATRGVAEAFAEGGVGAVLVVEALVLAAAGFDEDFVLEGPVVDRAFEGKLRAEKVAETVLDGGVGDEALFLAEAVRRGYASNFGIPEELLPEALFVVGEALGVGGADVGVAQGEEEVVLQVVVETWADEELVERVRPGGAVLAVEMKAPVLGEAMGAEVAGPAPGLRCGLGLGC